MTEHEEMLELAHEYEAGLQKCAASGYEEYGPNFQRRQQLIITALRRHAQRAQRANLLIQQLAWYYRVNDCAERHEDDAIEVPVLDLKAADEIARDLGLPDGPAALSSTPSEPAPSSWGTLERIAIVCTDNMDRNCDHRMALDFVRQIANDALDDSAVTSTDRNLAVDRDSARSTTVPDQVKQQHAGPGGGMTTTVTSTECGDGK